MPVMSAPLGSVLVKVTVTTGIEAGVVAEAEVAEARGAEEVDVVAEVADVGAAEEVVEVGRGALEVVEVEMGAAVVLVEVGVDGVEVVVEVVSASEVVGTVAAVSLLGERGLVSSALLTVPVCESLVVAAV